MQLIPPANRCQHTIARPSCACCSAEARYLTARVNADLSRRGFIGGSVALLGLSAYSSAQAQRRPPKQSYLFTNARIFTGLEVQSSEGASVLVIDDKIAQVAKSQIPPPAGALVIDARGRTLIPGLIDAHWHPMMASLPLSAMMTGDIGDIHLEAAKQAERTLMRGFTTVRDAGGPSFALKRAIDSGAVVGPRIYPSGAMVSQTSGHGDFRYIWELPGHPGKLPRADVIGAAALADGRDAVLRATREQLMKGASQVKIVAGGGASSPYDPIDVVQFLPEEIEAAVAAAADWGTYIMAHVYNAASIKRCVKAGVRSIEHGNIADEEAVQMMADKGVVWSLQPLVEENANPTNDPVRRAKQRLVWEGTDKSYRLAIDHKIPIGWGTDVLFDAPTTEKQGKVLAYMTRWFSAGKALKTATSENAFILAMSGERNPYPGPLGVIQAGAHADMLLVDGDPSKDLSLVADPDKNFKIIMKAGVIHKNTH